MTISAQKINRWLADNKLKIVQDFSELSEGDIIFFVYKGRVGKSVFGKISELIPDDYIASEQYYISDYQIENQIVTHYAWNDYNVSNFQLYVVVDEKVNEYLEGILLAINI